MLLDFEVRGEKKQCTLLCVFAISFVLHMKIGSVSPYIRVNEDSVDMLVCACVRGYHHGHRYPQFMTRHKIYLEILFAFIARCT